MHIIEIRTLHIIGLNWILNIFINAYRARMNIYE